MKFIINREIYSHCFSFPNYSVSPCIYSWLKKIILNFQDFVFQLWRKPKSIVWTIKWTFIDKEKFICVYEYFLNSYLELTREIIMTEQSTMEIQSNNPWIGYIQNHDEPS